MHDLIYKLEKYKYSSQYMEFCIYSYIFYMGHNFSTHNTSYYKNEFFSNNNNCNCLILFLIQELLHINILFSPRVFLLGNTDEGPNTESQSKESSFTISFISSIKLSLRNARRIDSNCKYHIIMILMGKPYIDNENHDIEHVFDMKNTCSDFWKSFVRNIISRSRPFLLIICIYTYT